MLACAGGFELYVQGTVIAFIKKLRGYATFCCAGGDGELISISLDPERASRL